MAIPRLLSLHLSFELNGLVVLSRLILIFNFKVTTCIGLYNLQKSWTKRVWALVGLTEQGHEWVGECDMTWCLSEIYRETAVFSVSSYHSSIFILNRLEMLFLTKGRFIFDGILNVNVFLSEWFASWNSAHISYMFDSSRSAHRVMHCNARIKLHFETWQLKNSKSITFSVLILPVNNFWVVGI